MIRAALSALVLLTLPAAAQEQTAMGSGAMVRALDRINGETVDLDMSNGQVETFGHLQITLDECRYPAGNPAGNAYALLEISEMGHDGTVFSGWMIASSPALSALDHRRYDVWVLRCNTTS